MSWALAPPPICLLLVSNQIQMILEGGGKNKIKMVFFFYIYKLRYVIVIVNIFMAVNLMDTVHKIRAGYLPYEFMIDISKN